MAGTGRGPPTPYPPQRSGGFAGYWTGAGPPVSLLPPQRDGAWLQPTLQRGGMAANPAVQFHGRDPRTLNQMGPHRMALQQLPGQPPQQLQPPYHSGLWDLGMARSGLLPVGGHPSVPQSGHPTSLVPANRGHLPSHQISLVPSHQGHPTSLVPSHLRPISQYPFSEHHGAGSLSMSVVNQRTPPPSHTHRPFHQGTRGFPPHSYHGAPPSLQPASTARLGVPLGEGPEDWKPLPPTPPPYGGGSGGVRDREEVDPFISDWMKIVASKRPKLNELTSMKLPQARALLARSSRLLQSLKHAHQRLSALDPSDGRQWTDTVGEVSRSKVELQSIRSQFGDEDALQRLVDKVSRCKAKRTRLQRQKKTRKHERERRFTMAEDTTSKWLEEKRKEELKKKTEKAVQADAGDLLNEVRRKQTDIQNLLKLAANLRELRDLRREASKKTGDAPPIEADEHFMDAHDSLVDLLTNQKAVYEDEEHALRVWMEGEVAEKMATSDHTQVISTAAAGVLSGGQEIMTPLGPPDPLEPFRDYYLRPQRDVKALLAVRSDWDSYMSPEGTAIPSGSVEATPPSNGLWAQYCTNLMP